MTRSGYGLIAIVGMLFMAGCSTVPDSIVDTPFKARPQEVAYPQPKNGSIFQSAAYRPLLEDRRARLVGDTMTIVINERTSAGKTAGNSASKTGSVDMGAPTIFGTTIDTLSAGGSSSSSFAEKGATSSSNTFSGTIGVTVIDVLQNGNLLVSGEKQVALDKGVEYVRFSGVVNPDDIVTGNRVSSAAVAEAKFEYRTNTRVDMAEFMSSLGRFFYSISPF
jgi:flagellar L-ring protein precursor FlgH